MFMCPDFSEMSKADKVNRLSEIKRTLPDECPVEVSRLLDALIAKEATGVRVDELEGRPITLEVALEIIAELKKERHVADEIGLIAMYINALYMSLGN